MKRVFIAAIAAVLLTVPAFAHGGPSPFGGGHGDGGPGFEPGEPLVAADGTAFIIRTVADSAAKTVSTQIVAVRPTGTIAWTSTLSGGRDRLLLSDGNLISESGATATDGTVSTTLTAISTSSGSQAWTRTLAGRVTSLAPFNGGTYAVVITAAGTTGGTPTRSLAAIGNDGSVLWTVSLP